MTDDDGSEMTWKTLELWRRQQLADGMVIQSHALVTGALMQMHWHEPVKCAADDWAMLFENAALQTPFGFQTYLQNSTRKVHSKFVYKCSTKSYLTSMSMPIGGNLTTATA